MSIYKSVYIYISLYICAADICLYINLSLYKSLSTCGADNMLTYVLQIHLSVHIYIYAYIYIPYAYIYISVHTCVDLEGVCANIADVCAADI